MCPVSVLCFAKELRVVVIELRCVVQNTSDPSPNGTALLGSASALSSLVRSTPATWSFTKNTQQLLILQLFVPLTHVTSALLSPALFLGISVNDDILSQTNPLLVVNHRTNAP